MAEKFFAEDIDGYLWVITTEDGKTFIARLSNSDIPAEQDGYEGSLQDVLVKAGILVPNTAGE